MGRKRIPPNQRALPISFSLKPHLIEKIDDYCHDHRFKRSKFLMEAVTQYMLKNDMGYHADTNVMEMSLARRVVIGLNALQEANREGELIPKSIMDALRNELGVSDVKHILADVDSAPENASTYQFKDEGALITFERVEAGLYQIYNHGTIVGHIKRDTNFKRKWIVVDDEGSSSHMTLQDAKDAVLEEWE